MKKYKLKMDSSVFQDMRSAIIPFIIDMLHAQVKTGKETQYDMGNRVCLSVVEEIDNQFSKRGRSRPGRDVTFRLSEYQMIVLMEMLQRVPIDANHFWRNNYRNNIIAQLDSQIV